MPLPKDIKQYDNIFYITFANDKKKSADFWMQGKQEEIAASIVIYMSRHPEVKNIIFQAANLYCEFAKQQFKKKKS